MTFWKDTRSHQKRSLEPGALKSHRPWCSLDAPVTVWAGDRESTVTWQAVFTGVSGQEVQVWGVMTMSPGFMTANSVMGTGTVWASRGRTLSRLVFPRVSLENAELDVEAARPLESFEGWRYPPSSVRKQTCNKREVT